LIPVFVIAGVFLFGCAQEDEVDPESSDVGTLPMVVVEDDDVRRALIDTSWTSIGTAFAGGPNRRREGEWMIEARWFRFDSQPGNLYTYDEMNELEAEGVINDETLIGLVRYRFLVEAEDLNEVTQKLEERTATADWPPEKVLSALKETPE
jgi:hypothetical protein